MGVEQQSLLPTYSGKKAGKQYSISFGKFAYVTLSLPFISFVFCVVWSIQYDFVAATATHCQVENYLPSISAAIGGFQPQITVWKLAISIHFLPRLLTAKQYYKYLTSVIQSKCLRLVKFTWLCNVTENFFLLGLSLVSSSENYAFHAFCFSSFIVTALVYMSCMCYLLRFCRILPPSSIELRSLHLKYQAYAIKLICFFTAGYFFWRHNSYCEPGVYTLFALFEYGVVLGNMAFHMTAVLDFHNQRMIASREGFFLS